MQVISEVLKNQNFQPDTDCLQAVFLAVYDGFIEEVDAIDNGVPMYSEGMPKYRINTHLSARIHRLNPEWNYPDEPTDKLFVKAMELVGAEFLEKVSEVSDSVSFFENKTCLCCCFNLFIFSRRKCGGQRVKL